ncbi:MAG: hypothetical protein C4576_21145 [Desulfobacteraceae bacterium]|nr:MAG: hypothetical protein C4576_21145 [Desulfobacteraceae bacterium]
MPYHKQIRFGAVAVEKGFITPGQLGKAVMIQMKLDLEKGIHKLLGELLVELGFMTDRQVEEVLQAQKG